MGPIKTIPFYIDIIIPEQNKKGLPTLNYSHFTHKLENKTRRTKQNKKKKKPPRLPKRGWSP